MIEKTQETYKDFILETMSDLAKKRDDGEITEEEYQKAVKSVCREQEDFVSAD